MRTLLYALHRLATVRPGGGGGFRRGLTEEDAHSFAARGAMSETTGADLSANPRGAMTDAREREPSAAKYAPSLSNAQHQTVQGDYEPHEMP